jgi:chromosome partitioning protein
MRVVSVWTGKGGAGKTTVAVNLCAAGHDAGLRVLLVCQDGQGSALHFRLPFAVTGALPRTRPDADLVVIDHPAAIWAIPDAPTVAIPTKATRVDYLAHQAALKGAQDAGKRVIEVLTDYTPRRPQEAALAAEIRRRGGHTIPTSGVFSRAAGELCSIFDLAGAYRLSERRQDFRRLLAATTGD